MILLIFEKTKSQPYEGNEKKWCRIPFPLSLINFYVEVDATLKNASVAAIRENYNKEYLHCLHQTVVNYQLF